MNDRLAGSGEERTWGMLAHLSALSGFIIPFGNIIGPLLVWLLKKDSSEFVEDQGRESLNFQISVLIYGLVSLLLAVIFIGFLLLIVLFVYWLVLVIVASVRANEGIFYRYPLTIRLLK